MLLYTNLLFKLKGQGSGMKKIKELEEKSVELGTCHQVSAATALGNEPKQQPSLKKELGILFGRASQATSNFVPSAVGGPVGGKEAQPLLQNK